MTTRQATDNDIINLHELAELITNMENEIEVYKYNDIPDNKKIIFNGTLPLLANYKNHLDSYIRDRNIDIKNIREMKGTINLFNRMIIESNTTDFDMLTSNEIIRKLLLIIHQNYGGSIKLVNTKISIDVIYNNKKYKRIIYINKNKKKFVKINKQLLELSKLKKA